ncbi:MAG: CapA family protein [Solirubrobacterales bacterium]|nr:CapA family protein [Solirubrobacterales bacterium]
MTLSFAGDLLVHEPVWQRALELGGGEYDFEPMFEPLRGLVERADISFCHLETPMTSAPPQGYPVFNTPPQVADAVEATGWDACSTASNHSLDQGLEGIAENVRILDKAGIEHTGTSAQSGERSDAAVLRAEGMRVALLSYTTDTNGLPVTEPASVNLADPRQMLADAERARREGADAVIVNIHWGSAMVPEYVGEPNPAQRGLVDELLSSQAITAVVGQGPHVVGPLEVRDGRGIVYSEGNLISNQGSASGLAAESQDGLIALLTLVDRRGQRPTVSAARYVPIYTTQPEYVVEPVGRALSRGRLDPTLARASYERTVEVAGRSEQVRPLPGGLGG